MTETEPAVDARLKSPFFRATILLPSYTRLAAPWPAETSGVRMVNADFEIPRSVLVGETADVYLQRGLTILRNEGVNPVVAIEFSPQRAGVLCGIAEVRGLLSRVLPDSGSEVWALEEGESVAAGEVALRVKAPYGSIGLYETAISGILAQSTGFASAARECVDAASGKPVIALGARHVHPEVAGILGYCAVIGGCVSCSTIQGSRLSGITPAGNMPHSLSLIMGGAVQAIEAFDRHMPQEVPRVALVDTFRDEAEEAISVARSLGEKLRGIRMNTPASRGGVTPALVKEVRARLDLSGYRHVEIMVSGGLTPQRIHEFVETDAPVDTFGIGAYIVAAGPTPFEADIHEVDARPVARRGHLPGITNNPRLNRIM